MQYKVNQKAKISNVTKLAMFTAVISVIGLITVQVQNSQNTNAYNLVSATKTAQAQEATDRKTQLENQEQHVYDVCNDSRISATISENNCGYLQDRYNMEFICKENNTSVNNMCWVEYKGTNWDKVQ